MHNNNIKENNSKITGTDVLHHIQGDRSLDGTDRIKSRPGVCVGRPA